MTEIIVVQCDHGDGECLELFQGFSIEVPEQRRNFTLRDAGWEIDDEGRHFCPKHANMMNEMKTIESAMSKEKQDGQVRETPAGSGAETPQA